MANSSTAPSDLPLNTAPAHARPVLPPPDNRWKDTVNIPPGSALRVRATFTGFAGTYVFHCHVLEHEDHAMMAQFRTV